MSESGSSEKQSISFGCPTITGQARMQAYEELREQCPVYKDPLTGHYVLTRYSDVRSVLINHRLFSNDAGMVGRVNSPVKDEVERIYLEKGPIPGRNLQTYDPPEHRIHRAPVDRAFDHWNVQNLRGFITDQAHHFVDKFIDRGEAEFVEEFGVAFPLRIFADQLGIAYEDASLLKLWADTAVEEINPLLDPEREIQIAHILAGMSEYFQRAITVAKEKPDDRLISKLVQTTSVDGELLAVEELLVLLRAIVVAAGDTTTFTFGNGMRILIDQPELIPAIREDDEKLLAFVEEAIRITSAVQTLFRKARDETVLNGVPIPKGAIIEARYGAADLDPGVFPSPYQADLDRENIRSHVGFGAGIHSCLGMRLARTELEIGFRTMVERMDNFRPARGEQSFEFSDSYITHGPVKAYLAFDRRCS